MLILSKVILSSLLWSAFSCEAFVFPGSRSDCVQIVEARGVTKKTFKNEGLDLLSYGEYEKLTEWKMLLKISFSVTSLADAEIL